MGIFIYLDISKSVTKKEWEDVYNETLKLVEKLPLAEKRKVEIHGVDTMCLVHTEERTFLSGWEHNERKIGWAADGDMETLSTAEEYFLPRDLVDDESIDKNAGDAILGACPSYLDYDWDDQRFKHTYSIWGSKTQGEPYHLWLLAIACLIEARLGTKAFIYGDITRGQCKKAVEIANEFLENKIDVPDRCYLDRLMKRINVLEFSEVEKIDLFECFYLGTQDASFGETLIHNFSKKSLNDYWKKRFKNSKIGTIGFDDIIGEYLLWGFEIDKLCKYIKFIDDDGNVHYEDFVKRIMDAKLHLKDKNCADLLKIDQEEEQPYSIWTLIAQFGFAGARNKKVDRYVPIEDIRTALKKGLDGKFDVDLFIDEYLSEEANQIEINLKGREVTQEQVEEAAKQDAAETFGQLMERKRKELEEAYEEYDINDLDDLVAYEPGNRIHPDFAESLGGSRKILDELLNEPEFSVLLGKSAEEKYRWIIERNRYILVKKEDWEQVYKNLEERPNSFARYYPLMRIDSGKNNLHKMTTALMINDALYQYTGELAEKIKESD